MGPCTNCGECVGRCRFGSREIVEGGGTLPTPDGEEYHLVDKAGRRAWRIDDEITLVEMLKASTGLSREDFVREAVLTPAQATAHVKASLSITEAKAKAMIAGDLEHGFAIDLLRKDLGLALGEARRNGGQLPVTALVDQFYAELQAKGKGKRDSASLVERLR